MNNHYKRYGHRERLFLSGFCISQNYKIDYVTPEESKDTIEGMITNNQTGEKFIVEVKIRECDLYRSGILIQEDKWYNMYVKYQEENAAGALYICSWKNCVTVTDITELNPEFKTQMQQNNHKDKKKIEKRVYLIKEYKKIIDNRLKNIYKIKV